MPVGPVPDPGATLPAGTVTFLLTDVEGSTPLWEADPVAMATAMRRHEELVSTAVAAHGGARPLEQGEGDNVVAAFPRASDGAAAALEAQLALTEEPWADGVTVRVRMALHTGEGHLQEGRTYAGPDLNRCARLRGLAHGGQIVVSRVTLDLLSERPPTDVTFRDLGVHRLKGIERPEHVHQLCHPALADSFPPLVSEAGHPGNLPSPASDLVGREQDRAAVVELFDQARLVTITGSGGAGKTRLALEIAHDALPHHPDGVWWVDLAALADPDLVAPALLAAIGERADPGRDPVDNVVAAVDERRLLVVLDNAEHLLDACAAVAEAVLSRAAVAKLLITSREPLGMDGEWPWRIPSLSVPPVDATVAEIAATPAVELFTRRARRVRPDFAVTEDNADDVAQICRRLDGLPLAIELAAARVRMMSPSRIAAGLDDRFRLLTGGGRRAVARQQTLQSSVEWSHGLLDEQERISFRRLAPFAGGFTIAAAEEVLADDLLDAYGVLDLVTRLVDKSLLVADAEGPDGRYHLLETIRQFAHDRLVAADEVEATRGRHLSWCVGVARTAEPHLTGADQQEWLDRLEDEHDNLRAAGDWAAATHDGEALWSLAGSLTFFWVLHGHFDEGVVTIARALAIGADVDPGLQVAGRWGSAYAAFYAGDYPRAVAEVVDVMARAEDAGDDRHLARALDVLGTVEIHGDHDQCRLHLTQAVELAIRTGDDWCRCDALQILAFTYLMQDDHERAAELLDESGALAEELGNHQLIGWDAMGRGWAAMRWGHLDDARRLAQSAIGETELTGDPAAAGLATWVLGEAAVRQGQGVEFAPVVRERLEQYLADGAGMAVPALAAALALAEAAGGNLNAARQAIDAGQAAVAGVYDQALLTMARCLVEIAEGHDDLALADLGASRAEVARYDNPVLCADVDVLVATIGVRRGETRQPEQLAHDALAVGVTGPFVSLIADAVEVLAEIALLEGNPLEATRLLGGVAAALSGEGAILTRRTAIVGSPDLDTLRAEVGDDAFDQAWADGVALTTDELVAYVSRSRGRRGRPSMGWDSLTPTELAVVELVAEGLTNKTIGERLFISPGTVKTHLAHVFAKLGAANRAEVAAEATRRAAVSG